LPETPLGTVLENVQSLNCGIQNPAIVFAMGIKAKGLGFSRIRKDGEVSANYALCLSGTADVSLHGVYITIANYL